MPGYLSLQLLQQSLLFLIGSTVLAFLLAPLLTALLYKYKIVRKAEHDYTLQGERKNKAGTPIMGGLLVIVVVSLITILFNWDRRFTYVPIGAMAISAVLGAADDLLNVFGGKRRLRNIKHTLILIKVHKKWYMKIWHIVCLPWTVFRQLASLLGSKQDRGVQAHEKLILQFLAGAVTAWWVYFKLGPSWHTLWIPFDGSIYVGPLIIPIIIFFVMFTANAVNISDGLDGLTGGALISTFLGLTLLSWVEGRTAFTPFNATAVGALIAYTYFNVKPARFQMGDAGSLGLGTLLAINAIAINKTLLLPMLGFIFYIEIISVITQIFFRRVLGRRFFKMSPLHHHFEIAGWNEEKIVMRFWIIHSFMVIVAVWIALR
ncbi:MAG: phospho-N-acetylmuramoyl-pentapeptide-transferase [Patescibacteria group bacterium]|jgi:phospho-N-acetylmuramoyl-pentapeptide-transferase